MADQELSYESRLHIRNNMSSPRHPCTEMLNGLNVLLDRELTVATALQVVDVRGEHGGQRSVTQPPLNMRFIENLVNHLGSFRAFARKEPTRIMCSSSTADFKRKGVSNCPQRSQRVRHSA
jgi:hypothetical protein